jgi:hypothetical protein
VALAKAAAKATSAKLPMADLGSVNASPAKPQASTLWHSTIQLRRRPRRSSTGKGTRSTKGAQRNLNE